MKGIHATMDDSKRKSHKGLLGRPMKRSTFLKTAAGVVAGGVALGGSAWAYAATRDGGAKPKGQPTVTHVADLTGQGHTDQFKVNGTDLGIPATAPDNSCLFVFGDSYVGPGPNENDENWRAPIGLIGDVSDLNGGVKWTGAIADDSGAARQFWDYQHNNDEFSTVLPGDIITIGDTMYLHVRVHKGLDTVVRTEIWSSTDNGHTWNKTPAEWAGDVHNGWMQQVTWALGDDNKVYVLSDRFIRDDGFIMHRVDADKITDSTAYEWWGWDDSAKKWGWGIATPGLIWTKQAGELCLRRIDNKWVLTFFNKADYSIDALLFDNPTDDLSKVEHHQLILGNNWGDPQDDNHLAQLYGGYIIPGSTLNDLHLTASQWKTDDNSIYRVAQYRVQGLGG
ncbi:MAG TPA: DUF4185 domain-containing protein [Stackebrandtia sp.]|jgi:signal peptidase I|uniref:DUF4185 domain-containing protein n=1 Tax=Stackebrandtia sp. TaxID=2023065 RepID=UPI002D5FD7E6|nr:DUF4185 domain-containing protein [Stackebrandtia sp.]HZE37663.1 DUF4185 domain-containing protein [Stackebrandtia sp.]